MGLPANTVRMCVYSPHWPTLYSEERERLLKTLGSYPVQFAHIGSTSVPGLAAKPIIDILLGVSVPEQKLAITAHLKNLGYDSHGEKGVPGRLFFTLGDPCCFHLHLVDLEGDIWHDHRLFRDSLIADPKLAATYEKLKKRLAVQFPSDRESYTRGKANFIENTIRDLRRH